MNTSVTHTDNLGLEDLIVHFDEMCINTKSRLVLSTLEMYHAFKSHPERHNTSYILNLPTCYHLTWIELVGLKGFITDPDTYR